MTLLTIKMPRENDNTMANVYIENMGCSRRALDSRRFEKYFLANGFKLARNPGRADYILFITCSFRKILEDFAIRRIRELSKYKAKLIVSGCLPGINQKRLDDNFKGESFSTSYTDNIDALFPDFRIKFNGLDDANFPYPINLLQIFREYLFAVSLDSACFQRLKLYVKKRIWKHYYYIRVAWGCIDSHCSYCRIWQAIGGYKSKPLETCLIEFTMALRNGHKNIMLIADNIGAWGVDINSSFPDLLGKLLAVNGDYNLDIEDMHPYWIIKYFERIAPFVSSGRIRSLLCPIQSGNSRILELMNRKHDAIEVKDILLRIKKLSPGIELQTSIIVGFPSETEDELQDTLELVKEIGFSVVNVYGYEAKSCVGAWLLEKELPEEIKQKRVKRAVKFLKKNAIACAVA